MDLEERFNEVSSALAEAQRQRARLEHEKEVLAVSLAASRTALQRDFGVVTADDARKVLESLENDLQHALSEAERLLEVANGGSQL